MGQVNNNTRDNNYLSNLFIFNQLTGGQISAELDLDNFSQDTNNLNQSTQSSANFFNYGYGMLQLNGSAIFSGTPAANILLGNLPTKFVPTKIYNLTVSVLRGSSYVQNTLKVIPAGSSIESGTVLVRGSYSGAPTLSVTGNGYGASLIARLSASGLSGIAAPGTSYLVGQTITGTGGTFSTPLIITIIGVLLVSGNISGAGMTYEVGNQITLLAVGGTTVTPAVIQVATLAGSAVATFTVINPGVFTGNPTSFTQASTTGSGTGFTLDTLVLGVQNATISQAGVFTVLPSNPISQGSTSGSGTGCTFNVSSFGLLSPTISTGGFGYTEATINVSSGAGSLSPVLSQSGNSSLVLATAPEVDDVIYLDSSPFLVNAFS